MFVSDILKLKYQYFGLSGSPSSPSRHYWCCVFLGMYYGDLREPVAWGSRAHATYNSEDHYAEGGGVIKLICSGTATIDGMRHHLLLPLPTLTSGHYV